VSAGDRVLDIACGTGIAARVARERLGSTGKIVGIDVSADMLSVARAVAPAIDWRQGKAGGLPLREGEEFDIVACQQGLQFFPDKPAAAAEMRRALAKGGRLAVATWRSDDEMPFLHELRGVAERYLGPIADQRYSFSDAAALERLLRDSGFDQVRVRTVSRTTRFDNGDVFMRLNSMAFVGMSTAGKSMGDEERKRIVDTIVTESAPVLKSYSDETGLIFSMSTNLAHAGG